ncbi:uncharacterized protein ACO6RY_01055 [Pungitius sinensis]
MWKPRARFSLCRGGAVRLRRALNRAASAAHVGVSSQIHGEQLREAVRLCGMTALTSGRLRRTWLLLGDR